MDTKASIEATVASVAAKASGGGSGAAIFGWLTSNEMLALLGVVIAFLGFVVNFIFQFRRDRREQELKSAQIAALQPRE